MSEREIFWRSVYTRIGNLGTDRAEAVLNTFLWKLEALCRDGGGVLVEEIEEGLEVCVAKQEKEQAPEN